ncbi:30S ribosomal protein S6 modification protein RimK [Planomonospora sphaerica]|uniref:30S ribosomal protein S6 modification protein RimK n=1 Tax=Planomonospora sphaerica TaxID=161355 RepID=A0A171DHF2_9ACTN|nr:ATP-grasp ribosomal peptide maturase [Planomonospora sphaerica]GAT68498.1 30S ribosomal protein S6 modification protein RimK [Planomonospora sphaerica]
MAGEAVLVLTCLEDSTADMVIGHLHGRGARVVRFDPGADFPAAAVLSAWFGDRMRGRLATASRHVDLERVRAVYYRRPTPYLRDDPSEIERFIATQARYGPGGVLATLPCRYVNHPWKITAAEHKPLQLTTAREAGFTVPATLITNSVADAREFAAEHGPIVYKPLRMTPYTGGGGRMSTIWTTPVEPGTLDETVGHAAHLFQARVDKTADLRVTVVGARVFCVRIESELLDWRQDQDRALHTAIEPPDGLAGSTRSFLAALGLSFGAFDFALGRDGTPVFLECNPNGQWGWLEEATGVPIAEAVADLLLEDMA